MSPARIAAALAVVAAWAGVTESGLVRHRAIASPVGLLRALGDGVTSGTLLLDLGSTTARLLAGLALGLAVGIVAGLGVGGSAALARWLEAPLELLRAIPPLLFFPLLLLVFGYGDMARVAAAALAVALVVSLHVAAGVRRLPQTRARFLRALNATRWQRVRWHLAYELAPTLATATQHAITASLVVTVVCEMLAGADHGLGARAIAAQVGYDAPDMWLALLVTGLLGVILTRGAALLERRVITWPA